MPARSTLLFVLGLLVGAGCGWLLHGSLREEAPAEAPEAARGTTEGPGAATAEPPVREAVHLAPSERPPAPRANEPAAEASTVTPTPSATIAGHEDLVTARAEALRRQAADAIARAESLAAGADELARRQIETELAQEAARLSDLEHGGLLELVQQLDDAWTPPQALLTSAEQFGRYFAPQAKGARLDPAQASASPRDIQAGDVL